MTAQIGQKAPDFKLFNTEKKEISLSDFQGKNLVILFFPLAFTGTCTTELCTIRDTYSDYDALNATVIGVSIDSLFSLGAYKKVQNFNFDLLSDFNKEMATAYDSLIKEFKYGMKGVSKRSAFVVDKEGIIRYKEICKELTDLPSFEAIKTCLKNI